MTVRTHIDRARDRVRDERDHVDEKRTAFEAFETLAEFLYAEFPVDHPVLATATRLDDGSADCQLAIRDHLGRRV